MRDLVKIHAEAIRRFRAIYDTVCDERKENLKDRRFYSVTGAQWEDDKEQYANMPKMEFNKVHMAVIKTINEYRNNRITVDFLPKDGGEDKTADICDSLLRADEQRSNAQDAYDTAFEEKVGGGIGAWELCPEYEDEEDPENDYQRIATKPINDADQSVFYALEAKRADKLDAPWCFVIEPMQTEDYKSKYNEDPVSWDSTDWGQFDWASKDVTYRAKYYVKEKIKTNQHYFKDIAGETIKHSDDEVNDELIAQYDAIGTSFSHTRKVSQTKVRRYVMSGSKILDDSGYIAGKYIPVVMDYGKRWVVNGIERTMGRVRLSRDPSRVKNMLISSLVDQASRSPVEIPIFFPEQVANPVIQQSWATANVKKPPYLTVDPITDKDGQVMPAAAIGYTKTATVSPAQAALIQLVDADMKEILGSNEQGDELKSNLSGEAVGKIHDRLDQKDFIYMDNHAKAMTTSGKIWLSMAQELYIEDGRKMKTVTELGQSGNITLGNNVLKDGEVTNEYDLEKASLDVTASVGASFSSKRKATVNTLTGLMQTTTNPDDMAILSLTAMMNIEGEGVDDLRDYARKKLVNMGVVKPTDEEQEEIQREAENTPPDPNVIYLEKAAMSEEADALKKLADTEKVKTDIEKSEAETEQIRLESEIKDRESGVNLINSLEELQRNQQTQTAETDTSVRQPASLDS